LGFRNLQEKLKVFFPLCRVLPSTPSSKFSFWRNTKRQKRESGVGLSIHWSLFIRDSLRFEFHIWLSNFYYRHLPNFCQLFRYFIVKNINTFKIHFRSVLLSFSLNAKPEIQILMGL
jgi:hypothetical protein